MIKQMAIVKRKSDMTHREYLDYIEHVHGVLARKYNNGTLLKYTQNHIYDGAYGFQQGKNNTMTTDYDSITELYFENHETMARNLQDPDTVKHIASDGVNFADEQYTIPLIVEEKEITVNGSQKKGMKVIYYLKKVDGISYSEYWMRLDNANSEILPNIPGIVRYIKNIPIGGGRSEHFHNTGDFSYEGVLSLWVNDIATFREYQRRLERASEKSPFFDPSYSFFVFCNEVCII